MSSLADRVIVITGAGRGLGRAMADRCGREGAHVAVLEIDPVGRCRQPARFLTIGSNLVAAPLDLFGRQVGLQDEISIVSVELDLVVVQDFACHAVLPGGRRGLRDALKGDQKPEWQRRQPCPPRRMLLGAATGTPW